MTDASVYQKIRRLLGNPTTDELPEDDLEEFFAQALLEYAYANCHYTEIDVTDGIAYDLSNITNIIDVVYVADTTYGSPKDFVYDSATKSLTVEYSGTVKIAYIISYTYDDVYDLDQPYVQYLCMAFCLEEIANVRDRVPTLSSFRLVSGDSIRDTAKRYLSKWESRFALSEVY